ncbi:hypothetical protein OPV22_012940 [Ensete ventricosum]|uniref:Uncharacterized protein n=1 Tax=Ensete ventricosum TaxID=4639 RepID=A0AAV8QZQ8_ENSVE|nr:hypothetical protein OPV22_012940 [Ensete ventricosum]
MVDRSQQMGNKHSYTHSSVDLQCEIHQISQIKFLEVKLELTYQMTYRVKVLWHAHQFRSVNITVSVHISVTKICWKEKAIASAAKGLSSALLHTNQAFQHFLCISGIDLKSLLSKKNKHVIMLLFLNKMARVHG